MGRMTDHIDEPTAAWIRKQHMFFVGDRARLDDSVEARSDSDIETYWRDRTSESLDGLAGLDR